MSSLFSYPDVSLTASLSGGSWQSTASLINLADPILSHKARSVNALAASTIVLADLLTVYNIRVVSICAHNLSAAATIRIKGSSTSAHTGDIADTGVVLAWPAGFTAKMVAEYPKNWVYCFPTSKAARYWKTEINDPTNPAGYVELGRNWYGEAFEPEVGISYGGSIGWEFNDLIDESSSGVGGEKRTPTRSLVGTFDCLTPAEKREALVMQKTLTGVDELFWVMNSTAISEDMLLEAFPAFIRKPSRLSYPYFNTNQMPFEVTERI